MNRRTLTTAACVAVAVVAIAVALRDQRMAAQHAQAVAEQNRIAADEQTRRWQATQRREEQRLYDSATELLRATKPLP